MDEIQQCERIINHYSSCMSMVTHLKRLIDMRKHYPYVENHDDLIIMETNRIRKEHLYDFGIPLEWNKKD